MVSLDDWRRQGQEKYLKGVNLIFRHYQTYSKKWDHDHCEFCGLKFSEEGDNLKEGYSTEDRYHWICSKCFNDFKIEFNWKVEY